MLDWAERHLAERRPAGDPGADGGRGLSVWVLDNDEARARLLEGRGYAIDAAGGWIRLL